MACSNHHSQEHASCCEDQSETPINDDSHYRVVQPKMCMLSVGRLEMFLCTMAMAMTVCIS